MEGTLKASTMGTCGCPGTPSVDHLGKNIQNLSGTLFAFEIFEIVQKTKKLALLSNPLDFFKDGYRQQEAILENFLDFPLPISDICLY